jgi:hypothetical protein
MKLYTIGFTQKPAERFFALLREHDVERVVDIRLKPGGQLSLWTRHRLQTRSVACSAASRRRSNVTAVWSQSAWRMPGRIWRLSASFESSSRGDGPSLRPPSSVLSPVTRHPRLRYDATVSDIHASGTLEAIPPALPPEMHRA